MNNSFVDFNEIGGPVAKSIQAIIALIGFACNTLAICVFERKELKKRSYSIYWKLKASFENIILLHFIRNWVKVSLNIDFTTISSIFCRLNQYVSYVAIGVSLWLEFIITLDRFFTIVFPTRFKFNKKRSFRIGSIFVLLIYNILLYINLPLNYRLNLEVDTNGNFFRKCNASTNTLNMIFIISISNSFIVNIVLNPILDVLIISRIISTRRYAQELNRWTINDRNFAICSIGINLSTIILKFPFIVFNTVSNLFSIKNENSEIVYTITLMVALIDKIDVFTLNMLVNSLFRREFLSMVGYFKKKRILIDDSTTRHENSFQTRRETFDLIPRPPLC